MKQVLLMMCALLALCGQVFADQSVTAVGRAEVAGSNRDGARSTALANAFREAVEKGVGVWIQSQTEVKDATLVQDKILTRAEGYVTDHEIVKEKVEDGVLTVTIRASVAVDKIGADIKSLVGRVSLAMGNPSIAFVLTTWEQRGQRGSSSSTESVDALVTTDVKSSHDEAEDAGSSASASASGRASGRSSSDTSVSARERGSVAATTASAQRSSGSASGSISAAGQYREGNGYAAGRAGHAASGEESLAESESLSASGKSAYDGSAKVKTTESSDYVMKGEASESRSTRSKGHSNASASIDAKMKAKQESSYAKIDEEIWVKYPDSNIIDSFNSEFKQTGFKVNAADSAREIALAGSVKETSVNPFDRSAVRRAAEKEGVNFVARGEVKMLDTLVSKSNGNTEVTSEIGVEIIDVASGDIVAAYRNTVTAGSSRPKEARAQSIKKAAVLAARTLADQTLETWQNASLNGRDFTVEVRNIKSKRAQERPILAALESLGTISSNTNPEKTILLVKVQYKGMKKKLEDDILDQLGTKPGFSEAEFDGPETIDGKIVFTFK